MKKIALLCILSITFLLSACDFGTTITFKFDTDGGSLIDDVEITPPNVLLMPDNPEKEGYHFLGWFFDFERETLPFNNENLTEYLSQNEITLYAKWELVTYKITYFLDQYAVNNNITSYTIQTTYTLENLTRDGYVFNGWFLDENQTQPITEIKTMSGDLTLYGFFEEIIIYYEVQWKNYDNTLLETDTVRDNTLPTYDGLTPTKPEDDTYTYTFTGWSPMVSFATQDQTYVATFDAILKQAAFDATTLNDIFGYNVFSLMPVFETNDYVILDDSDNEYDVAYIDMFDWTEEDALDYIDILDTTLAYDAIEDSWILGNYFIYVYEDTFTYPNETVYGIGIYGLKQEYLSDMMEVIDYIEITTEDNTISNWLAPFEGAYDISITVSSNIRIEFFGFLNTSDTVTLYTNWKNQLITNGLALDGSLSNTLEADVFVYEVSDTLHYALYLNIDTNTFDFVIWSYNPNVEVGTLQTLSYMQSINAYEKATYNQSGLPNSGTFDVLVIPIEIKGTPFPSNYMQTLELAFNGTSESTGWESVSSYFYKSSFGNLNMSFDIATKYITSQTKSYYEGFNSDGDQYAIYEALIALDDTIDFSQYDYNQDGTIDSIYFVFSVGYDYDIEPWWAWVFAAKYGEASKIDTLDTKAFEYYMWASYAFLLDSLPNAEVVVNAETIIHETGHLLGADDMYSYTENYGPVGGMHMMDYNNGDFEPWHKLLFGWLRPFVATQGTYQVTLESYALDTDGLASALVIPYNTTQFNDGDAFDEFIIIIFYTPDGLYEAHQGYEYVLDIPAIMVYHIDARLYEDAGFWGDYFYYNNDGTSDFFAELLEVDKNNSLDTGFISNSDVLRSGVFDLSSYRWHQNNAPMNITIQLASSILITQTQVTFTVTIS
jgi:M6 family metalloprotease-like protein/uncharacterized repeat protein (TIGR02543 family)